MSRDEKCGFLSSVCHDWISCLLRLSYLLGRLLQRRAELSELIREPKVLSGSLAKVNAVLDCSLVNLRAKAIKLAGCCDHLPAEFRSNLMSQCEEIIPELGEFAVPTAASPPRSPLVRMEIFH
jgi:hypothetical protein